MGTKNTARMTELLEICFDVFCENGLENSGMKKLADACGMTTAGLVHYFGTKDAIVISSTAHCMAKVENDFMANAPQSFEDIERFLQEMPYMTARLHGAKYRFMYQVYASPHYREHGKEFFRGVTLRYTEYAKELAPKVGIPWEDVQSLIFMFVRASVHYALFEDEEYLQSQLRFIRKAVQIFRQQRML